MEALRGALHEHKENVEAGISRGKIAYNELPGNARTPGGKLQPFSTPKSVKASNKSSSTTKKPRRALGDISNQHRTPLGNKSNSDVLGKRTNEGEMKAKFKSTTPASAKKARTSVLQAVTPKRAAAPVTEKVEEIEFAYGGLPSFGPDPAYLDQIREEIQREIHDDSAPTIMDQYTIEDTSLSRWEPEMSLLDSGAAPSPWWSTDGPNESLFTETITWSDDSIQSTVDLNTPEPDVCDDLQPEDNDSLLDEILNIDIPVSLE